MTAGSRAVPAAGRFARRAGLAERGEPGAPAEDEALEQRVRGEPVRAVDAGRGALAGGVEPGHGGRAVEVGDDAADRVVRGGETGIGSAPGRSRRARASPSGPGTARARSRADRGPAWPRSAIARATTSRGASSSVKRLPSSSTSTRALAAQRLGEQEAVVERGPSGGTGRTRGRRAPRPRGRRARAPRRARRAGSSSAPRAPRTRPVASTVAGAATAPRSVTTPTQRPPLIQSCEHANALGERDPRVLAHALGEDGGDRLAGLGAAGVHDAAHRVAALAAEPLVELDAELDQVGDARRRLLGEHLDGARTADAAPGAERVGGVQLGRVALPHRRGDAALRVPAVRGVDGRLREQQHVGLGRRGQRGGEARDAAADDDRPVRSTLARERAPRRFYPHSR